MSTAPVPDSRARLRIGVGAALVLSLVGVACAVALTALAPHGEGRVVTSQVSPAAPVAPIYVHILGQVQQPGLYALQTGDRGVDIVAAAGGFAPDADQRSINLARFLTDGEQIVVPAIGETVGTTAGVSNGLISLNSADAAALDTLPRIGPALAERILAWREKNGPFTSVDDLLAVSGIGSAIVEGLRDLVTT